ncbi:MAG: phosphoadenylyl-sulfate reductase [Sulfurimonas sp.]|nr:phosphoadenylyl-sulfate reductase [Sulfurimonas sp.]
MDINDLNKKFKNVKAEEILKYFFEKYGNKVALSSSFGVEDQVLTHMMLSLDKKMNIFTLDTARLHPQTYSVMDATNLKYGVKVNVFFPDTDDVEKLYQSQGINGFYESIQNRKACCFTRKIKPLQRALSSLDVWITGLRASQSITRQNLSLIEYDEVNKVIKVNPLLHWSEDEIWDFIKKYKVPYNSLHDEGFPSIGCAPCTRAVESGADVRSGRWWWENPEHKECGLHIK